MTCAPRSIGVPGLPKGTFTVKPAATGAGGIGKTWNVCVTGDAGLVVLLPGCEAVIEHVPALTRVTELPETVQIAGEFDAYETASPELALAFSVTGPAFTSVSSGSGKVMTLPLASTRKVWVTGVAGLKLALPGCEAVMEQAPRLSSVTVLPLTEQTYIEFET